MNGGWEPLLLSLVGAAAFIAAHAANAQAARHKVDSSDHMEIIAALRRSHDPALLAPSPQPAFTSAERDAFGMDDNDRFILETEKTLRAVEWLSK